MDSLNGLTKIVHNATVGKKSSSSDSASAAKTASSNAPSSAVGDGDLVNISPSSTLDYIKSQAADLKVSLPGMLASSLLQPVADDANSQNPLNALLNKFVNPARSFLASSNSSDISKEQLKSLQEEVVSLKNHLPALLSNALLTPLQGTGNSADSIVQSLSNHLTDLATQVQQKINT